jgi:hypothetical protein
MSDRNERSCRTVFDSTYCMSVDVSFGRPKVLFEIQLLRRVT